MKLLAHAPRGVALVFALAGCSKGAGPASGAGASTGRSSSASDSSSSSASGGNSGTSGGTGGALPGSGGSLPGSGGAGGNDGGATQRSDIVGKITVGYQGWFDAVGDSSGINPPWWHWTPDRNTPSPTDIGIKSWPDVSDYAKTYPTSFPNLGGGAAATLYSSWDASTIDTQVQWMQATGIDTIALQRFGDFRGAGQQRNVVASQLKTAAEAHGRKFYIMYDISGWDTFQDDLKTDWTMQIVGELNLPSSPAYAMQDGKPVVCIWGLGYTGHPGTPTTTLDVVKFFQSQGLYVIGGVGNDWRTADGTRWSQAGFGAVFDALDAISWHQFYNMIQIGSDGLYTSMFDEYNEGNQIAKTAPTSASVPAGSGFLSLDEDGTACSSDYYMRLTGDGGKMLKGQIALTPTRPTPTQ
jgi:hypothetical protein